LKTLVLSAVTALGIGSAIFVIFSHMNLYPLVDTPHHDSSSYTTFETPGLQHTYLAGQTVDFKVIIRGHGVYSCTTPTIRIYNDITPGESIFDVNQTTMSCPVPMQQQDYEFYFPSKNDSFTATVSKPGNYTLEILYGGRTVQDTFHVA